MVDNTIGSETIVVDGQMATVEVGDVSFTGTGFEIGWATTTDGDSHLRFGFEIVDTDSGETVGAGSSSGGALAPVQTSGRIEADQYAGQYEFIIFTVDGHRLFDITFEIADSFASGNMELEVRELTSGPYDANPTELPDPALLEYEVVVTNQNPDPSPVFEVEVLADVYPESGFQQNEVVKVAVGPGESKSFVVVFGDNSRASWNLSEETVCAEFRSVEVGGESVDIDGEACFTAEYVSPPNPDEFRFGGRLISWRGVTNGSTAYSKTIVYDGTVAEGGDLPTVRAVGRVENAESGDTATVFDETVTLTEGTTTYNTTIEGDWNVPAEWGENFDATSVVELTIDGLSGGPHVTETYTQSVGEEPSDPEPEPDPDPTEPPVEAACDFDGAEITAGGTVTVPVDVTAGDGDTDTTATVEIEVAGQTASETVTLEPNGSVRVEASYEIAEPGEYTPTITLT